VHWLALQLQAAAPFATTQVWFVPHVAVVTHSVQLPPGIFWQVCAPLGAHCVCPAVH
jgi:hypothetical protein